MATNSLPNLKKPNTGQKTDTGTTGMGTEGTQSLPNLKKPGSGAGTGTGKKKKINKMAMTAPAGPSWLSDHNASRYGSDFAERICVPSHYPRRQRLKDPYFYGVTQQACDLTRTTRAPRAGPSLDADDAVTPFQVTRQVQKTAEAIEMVDLFFNWNAAFGKMTNEQNKRLVRLMSTSSKAKVTNSLSSTSAERTDLTLKFGDKYKIVKGSTEDDRSASPTGKSLNRRAQHLQVYATGKVETVDGNNTSTS